jgi:hypothetical protein
MAKRKKKTSRKKRGRRPGIAGMSIAQLEAAVERKKAAEARKLREKRSQVARALAALDREIAALTGRAPTTPKKRVSRKKRGRTRPKKKVTRTKRGRRKKKKTRMKRAKKAARKRVRSTSAQIERVQASVLKALKGERKGLLKVELAKGVRARPQALNTALKKLIDAKKVKTKGVTRNTRYLAA